MAGVLLARPLIERLACCRERLHEDRANLGLQPPPDDHRSVLFLIHVQRATRVPQGGLASLGVPIHPSPAADDPLDVLGRAVQRHRQQPRFRLWRCHASDGSHFRVGELAAGERRGQPRKRAQSARHPDVLSRRADIEPHPPAQPVGARAEPRVPALARVELTDEVEQAGSRSLKVS
jgi:hypothetical protein